MSFRDEMEEGFSEGLDELGTVPVVIAGTEYRGSFDPLDEEQTVVLGGQEVKITATVVLPRSQFAAGQGPKSQRLLTVDGAEYRAAAVTKDELAFTVLLKHPHAA